MYDIIAKKKIGYELTLDEIEFAFMGFTREEIPDYQMSALLMAIYFNGMTLSETINLTKCMANSGEKVDLSEIQGIKVDKHSTGGVGDKTTLIVTPIVAACGVKVAKMSGKGLGFTGGTIDKLESIKGFDTCLSIQRFIEAVNKVGACIAGGTSNLAPADKKLYALRDVTATVDSIPLIASSIMSKKLASGADGILLDVKTGSGAFMKSIEDSIKLAQIMVDIGYGAGKKVSALITNMDIPLGNKIGNSLEVVEAVQILKGAGPKDLTQMCVALAVEMLVLAGRGDADFCTSLVEETLSSGSAFEKLCEIVTEQGGDAQMIREPSGFTVARVCKEVISPKSGYITKMDTEAVGISSVMLGAGRDTKDSEIDYSAGIDMKKKTGDYVKEGETVAVFYTQSEELFDNAAEKYLSALTISGNKPSESPLIYAKVEKSHIMRYE
jgi:pyrimidine-nucleoside phosphorylase